MTTIWLRSVLLLGLTIAGLGTAQAQFGQISGIVTDQHSVPLPGVNVAIVELGLGAATDIDGRFLIGQIPHGTHTLRVTAVGFDSFKRQVHVATRDTLLRITLKEIAIMSSEIVVTASRQAKLSLSVPASFSLITARDLDARNIVSLDQALRYVPGVQVLDNQVNIRGSSGFSFNTGSRVLLLLDGLPLLSPESDGIPFDALPFAQVERIEIIKGPGSAAFGGGALGGVINVITRDFPAVPEYHVKIYSGLREPVRYDIWRKKWPDGGNSWRSLGGATFSHARRLGPNVGFWLNLDYREDQGYTFLGARRILQGFGKLGWTIGRRTKASILMSALSRKKDTFLFWNGITDALNPGMFALGDPLDPTGSADAQTNEFIVQPSVRHIISDKLLLQTSLRFYGILIYALDTEGKKKPLSDGTIGFRYGGEAQLDWAPNQHRNVIIGISGDANTTESSFFATGDGDQIGSQPEAALFVQLEEQIDDKLTITGGLRFDTYRIDGAETVDKLSPKLAASYQINPSLALRSSYGQGFRVPGLAERFVDNQDRFPLFPNPELRPEENTSYEIGGRILTSTGVGSARFDIAAFWNDYSQLIEPVLGRIEAPEAPPKLGFQFVNLTRARIRGVEVGVDATLLRESLTIKAGYTLLESEDLDLGNDLPFRPDHLLTAGLDARPLEMIELGADFRFAATPDVIDSDFVRFVPDADILVATRVTDLRIALVLTGVRLSMHVNNAFDYYYLERPAFLASPRHYILQLTVDW